MTCHKSCHKSSLSSIDKFACMQAIELVYGVGALKDDDDDDHLSEGGAGGGGGGCLASTFLAFLVERITNTLARVMNYAVHGQTKHTV